MNVFVLKVVDPEDDTAVVTWLFDNGAELEKAQQCAVENNIFVSTTGDYISDFQEFCNWMQEKNA